MLNKIRVASVLSLIVSLSLLVTYFLISAKTIDDRVEEKEPIEYFLGLINSDNTTTVEKNIDLIEDNWTEGFEIMLVETLYFLSLIHI